MHSKFVGHSTEIIWQSKIKGPLPDKKLSKKKEKDFCPPSNLLWSMSQKGVSGRKKINIVSKVGGMIKI